MGLMFLGLLVLAAYQLPATGQTVEPESQTMPTPEPASTGSAVDLRISPRFGAGHDSSGAGYDDVTHVEGFIPLFQTPGDSVDPAQGGNPLPTPDTDGDGVKDFRDRDIDNDRVMDVLEAGGSDANGDGFMDGFTDTDGNGLADRVDGSKGGQPLPVFNTNSDNIANYRDLDSDNDGIGDVLEAGGSDPDRDGLVGSGTPLDPDGDGVSSSVDLDQGGTPLSVPDLDGDLQPNYRDLDSDNDGIKDLTELGATLPDTNSDGQVDGVDSDGDGLIDGVDGNAGGFIIVGGFGKDTLTGGQGRDRFVYRSIKDFGDVVTDFEILKDRFDFKEIFKHSGSMANIQLKQRGDDVLLKVNADSGFKTLGVIQDVEAETLKARHLIL